MSIMFYIIISLAVFITIFAIVLSIIVGVKASKNMKNLPKQQQEESSNNEVGNLFKDLGRRIRESVDEIANPNIQCEYCKTTYSRKEKKCPSCGAAKPKK